MIQVKLLRICILGLAVMSFGVCLLARASDQPGVVVSWGTRIIPRSFYDGKRVIQVAGGQAHSLALKSDGTVMAWGQNYSGASTVPAGLNGVIQIAAGGYYTLRLSPTERSWRGETILPVRALFPPA